MNELLELTRENNKILRGMQRSARVNRVFKLIYWGLIIASFVGTYYYIQPYLDQVLKLYNQASSTLNDVKSKASQIPDFSKTPGAADIVNQLDSMTKKQ